MKRNATTRIIIYSIIIVILLGILLTGLGIGFFMVNFDFDGSGYSTAEQSEVSLSPSDIRNIEIEWASGKIDIQAADTDTITFYESGKYEENQQMVWKQNGDTLIISYSKPTVHFGFFSYSDKDLKVTVPKDWHCDQLSLDVASADLSLEALSANEVDLSTASGECEFLSCTIDDLEIDTASGSIYYQGSLNTLDCDAASSDFTGEFSNVPYRIQMDSASGDLDITLQDNCGFHVTMDALSGKFYSDYPAVYTGDHYIYGNEACDIDFDGVSGSIKIRRPE